MNTEYKIFPYHGVTGILLDSKREDFLKNNKPSTTIKSEYSNGFTDYYNDLGISLFYISPHNDGIFLLKEISFWQNCGRLILDEMDFFTTAPDDVLDFLENNDPSFRLSVGMYFYPRYGISISGFENEDDDNEGDDKVVTVYAKDRFDFGYNI